MAIHEAAALDVSNLPTHEFGQRDPLWWGIVLAIAIETTVFAIVWSTYFYLRMQEATWPPWRWSAPDLLVGSISTAAILATAIPMRLMEKAAKQFQDATVRLQLILFFVLTAVAGATRVWEYMALQVKWDSNAYGSVVWMMLTLHTTHIITSVLETLMLAIYLFVRTLDPKHALDVEVGAIYWYFVVASWIPNYVLIYFGPHMLN
jgi:heme/copper-type cytochrome/quinol oxidase subunit 3